MLLLLAAAALRGYLPGVAHTHREPATDDRGALDAVFVMLSVSMGIVAIAIVIRLRERRGRPTNVEQPLRSIGRGDRPTWHWLLIGLAVLAVWVVVVLLLLRLGAHHGPPAADQSGIEGQAPPPGSNSAPHEGATAPPRRPSPDNTLDYVGAATIVFLLLLAIGGVISRRQQRGRGPYTLPVSAPEPPTAAQGPESIARAAELGLAEIGDLSREPREAIIACYATMERELAKVPGAVPQDCDTPTEVLARAVEHHALRAEGASRLVELFAEARFSPHVMTEGHREVAVAELAHIVAELRSAV